MDAPVKLIDPVEPDRRPALVSINVLDGFGGERRMYWPLVIPITLRVDGKNQLGWRLVRNFVINKNLTLVDAGLHTSDGWTIRLIPLARKHLVVGDQFTLNWKVNINWVPQ